MSERVLLALLLLPLPGCLSFCDGKAELEAARAGALRAVAEVGETGRTVVPSSFRPVVSVREAMNALLPALESEDPVTRLTAVESLRRLSERARDVQRDLHPHLFDQPLADPEVEIRWRAAWAMGRLERTSPALRAAVADPAPRVAERAAWALGVARDPEAVEVLIAALDREEPVGGRAQAALERIARRAPALGRDGAAWRRWFAERDARRAPPGGD